MYTSYALCNGTGGHVMAISTDTAMQRLHQLLQAADRTALTRFLTTLQPNDLGELVLPLTETRRRQVFESLDLDTAARTLASMDFAAQYAVVTSLPLPSRIAILENMPSDDLTDL